MAQYSKIERFAENITGPVIVILSLGFAVATGYFVGHGAIGMVMSFIAFITSMALVISLGRRIWVMVVIGWPLIGVTSLFPLAVRVVDIIVLFVFSSFFALTALKLIRTKPKVDTGDGLIAINVGYLCVTFLRNPVGVSALGSNLVGGRPYFNVFIAVLAYLILRKASVDEKSIRRLPVYLLIGSSIATLAPLVGMVAPGLGTVLSDYYSGFAPPLVQAFDTNDGPLGEPIGRLGSLQVIGGLGMTVLCARYRPSTLIMPVFPGRFFLWLLCIAADLFSGFRSSIIYAGAFMVVGSIFRRRYRDIFIMGFYGIVLVLFLDLGNNTLFKLPLSAQRALTFLPGNWDPRVKQDAEDSTQWRIDMWRTVLLEDRWIKNKWFGDGFGFSKEDLFIMKSESLGYSGFAEGIRQETQMIVGAFHSGPLSAIRFVGVAGFILFMWLLIYMARRAYALTMRCKDTELFMPMAFVSITVVLFPFLYVLIFGAFDFDFPVAIFSCGMIRLMSNALEQSNVLAPGQENVRRRIMA